MTSAAPNIDSATRPDTCPVCDTGGNEMYFRNAHGGEYYQCRECGCVFIDNCAPPDPYPVDAIKGELLHLDFTQDLRSNKLWTYTRGHMRWTLDYLPRSQWGAAPRALSIGCAHAHDLHELALRGFDVLGVDHDQSICDRVKAQHGITVNCGFFENMEFDGDFDLVIMASVVPYFHGINRAMAKAAQLTRPSGHLFISIRNMDFADGREVLAYPTNVHARQYFPRKSLELLLRNHGFELSVSDCFHVQKPLPDHLPRKVMQAMDKIGHLHQKSLNLWYRWWLRIGHDPFLPQTLARGQQLRVLARRLS